MIKRAMFGVLGLSMLPGCPLLDAEVDVGEVCLTYPDVQVPGAAAGGTLQNTFTFGDLSSIHDLVALDAHLQFTRGEARVKSGTVDFPSVDTAHLTIASGDPSSTLPTLVVYDCHGDCLADGTTLALPSTAQQDLVEYVKGDSIVVGLDLDGHLPATAWSMDVDVCMKGNISYTVAP